MHRSRRSAAREVVHLFFETLHKRRRGFSQPTTLQEKKRQTENDKPDTVVDISHA